MEKNNEKSAYFAQYWGQKVATYQTDRGVKLTIGHPFIDINDIHQIELTPLSAITDEDAEILGKYRYSDPKGLTFIQIGKSIVRDYLKACMGDERITFQLAQLEQFEIDHLRSKGYALPFRNYSVEQLIEMGWLKLRQT